MFRKPVIVAALAALALAVIGVAGAFAYSTPAPKNFWKKNYRLGVVLQDHQDGVFDASLTDISGSIPRQARYYLQENLGDGTFEIDSSHAKCFEVSTDANGDQSTQQAACADVAELVDNSADGVGASILGRPTLDENGDLAFAAKKIVVWL
jgi:hypothetical protein